MPVIRIGGNSKMNTDNSLDLLDLDDESSVDALPEAPAFAAPRPKKPWLLLTVGLAVIVLATYVIISVIGGESSSSIEVDLDAPAVVIDGAEMPEMNVMPPVQPVQVQPKTVKVEEPKLESKPVVVESVGTPVRVIEERKEVQFKPAQESKSAPAVKEVKQVVKPATTSDAKPAVKTAKKAPAKTTTVTAKPATNSWYVQFGSYSSRALAESAQKKMMSSHSSLFAGKQFVILAAQLKDGSTTYRLRVAFANSNDANGFCRNAKADGLDCYVAR